MVNKMNVVAIIPAPIIDIKLSVYTSQSAVREATDNFLANPNHGDDRDDLAYKQVEYRRLYNCYANTLEEMGLTSKDMMFPTRVFMNLTSKDGQYAGIEVHGANSASDDNDVSLLFSGDLPKDYRQALAMSLEYGANFSSSFDHIPDSFGVEWVDDPELGTEVLTYRKGGE
jgi:hypothetical protein